MFDLPPVLALLARLSLLGHFLARHVDEEVRGFAAAAAPQHAIRPGPCAMVHVGASRMVDPITPDQLVPQPHELVSATDRRTRSPGGRRWPTAS